MQLSTRFRPQLRDCNPHLTCGICHGYLIDATSNPECLHSFCRGCIFQHLKLDRFCPVCRRSSNSDTLVTGLSHDTVLQSIVYKVVPNLYRNEMQRRIDFLDNSTDAVGWRRRERRSMRLQRNIYTGTEHMSLRLVRCDSVPIEFIEDDEFTDYGEENQEHTENSTTNYDGNEVKGNRRYLLCPVEMTIGHLKKYIRFKFDMDQTFEVEMYHTKGILSDEYSLMDVAYIYNYDKVPRMTLYYVVFETVTENPTVVESECNNNSVTKPRGRKRKLEPENHRTTPNGNGDGSPRDIGHNSSALKKSKCQTFPDVGSGDGSASRREIPKVPQGSHEQDGLLNRSRDNVMTIACDNHDFNIDSDDLNCLNDGDASLAVAENSDIIAHITQNSAFPGSTGFLDQSDTPSVAEHLDSDIRDTVSYLNPPFEEGNERLAGSDLNKHSEDGSCIRSLSKLQGLENSISGYQLQENIRYHEISESGNFCYSDRTTIEMQDYFRDGGNAAEIDDVVSSGCDIRLLQNADSGVSCDEVLKTVHETRMEDSCFAAEADQSKDSDAEIDTEIRRIAANVAISNENSMTDYGMNEDSESALASHYTASGGSSMGEVDPGVGHRNIMDSITISQLFAPPTATSSPGNIGVSVGNFLVHSGAPFDYQIQGDGLPQTTLGLESGNVVTNGDSFPKWADYVDAINESQDSPGFRILPTEASAFPLQNSAILPFSNFPQIIAEQPLPVASSVPGLHCFSGNSPQLNALFPVAVGAMMTTTSVDGNSSFHLHPAAAAAETIGCSKSQVSVDNSSMTSPTFSSCDHGRSDNQTNFTSPCVIIKTRCLDRILETSGCQADIITSGFHNSEKGLAPSVWTSTGNASVEDGEESDRQRLMEDLNQTNSDCYLHNHKAGKALEKRNSKEKPLEPCVLSCLSRKVYTREMATQQCKVVPPDSTAASEANQAKDDDDDDNNDDDSEACLLNGESGAVASKVVEPLDERVTAVKANATSATDAVREPTDAMKIVRPSHDKGTPAMVSPKRVGTKNCSPCKRGSSKEEAESVSSTDLEDEVAVRKKTGVGDLGDSTLLTGPSLEVVSNNKGGSIFQTTGSTNDKAGNSSPAKGMKATGKMDKESLTSSPSRSSRNKAASHASSGLETRPEGGQASGKISVGTQTNSDVVGRYFRRRVNPVNSFSVGKSTRNGSSSSHERSSKSTRTGVSLVTTKCTNTSFLPTVSVSAGGPMTSQAAILFSSHGAPILIPAMSPVTINGKSTFLITVPGNFSFQGQNGLRPNMTLIQTRLNYPRSTATALPAVTPLVIHQGPPPTSQAMVIGRAVGPPLQLLVPSGVSTNPAPEASASKDPQTSSASVSTKKPGLVCRFTMNYNQQASVATITTLATPCGPTPTVLPAVVTSAQACTCTEIPSTVTKATSLQSTVTKANLQSTSRQSKQESCLMAVCSSVATPSYLTLSAATVPTFVLSSATPSAVQNQNSLTQDRQPNPEPASRQATSGVEVNARTVDNVPSASKSSTTSTATHQSSSCVSPSSAATSPKVSEARHFMISQIPHVGNKFSVSRRDSDPKPCLGSSLSSTRTPTVHATLPNATTIQTTAATPSDIRVSFHFDQKFGNYSVAQGGQKFEGASGSLIRAILEQNLASPYDIDRSSSNAARLNELSVSCTVTKSAENLPASQPKPTDVAVDRDGFPPPATAAAAAGAVSTCDGINATEKTLNLQTVEDKGSYEKRKDLPVAKTKSRTSHPVLCQRGNSTVNGKTGNSSSAFQLNESASMMKAPRALPVSGIVTRSQRAIGGSGKREEVCNVSGSKPSIPSALAPSTLASAASRRRSAAEAAVKETSLAAKRRRRSAIDQGHGSKPENLTDPSLAAVFNEQCSIGITRSTVTNESPSRCSATAAATLLKTPPVFPKFSTADTFSTASNCRLPVTVSIDSACLSESHASTAAPLSLKTDGQATQKVDQHPEVSGSASNGTSKPVWASMAIQTRSGMVALPKKVYTYFGSALSHEHIAAREKNMDGQATTTISLTAQSKEDPTNVAITNGNKEPRSTSADPTTCYLSPNDDDLETQDKAPPINQLRRMCSFIHNGSSEKSSPMVETELLPPRLSPYT